MYTSLHVHDHQCHRSQFRSHQPLLSAPPLSSTPMRLLGCDKCYLGNIGQAAELQLVQAQPKQQVETLSAPLHTNSTLVFVMSGAKAVEAYMEGHSALTCLTDRFVACCGCSVYLSSRLRRGKRPQVAPVLMTTGFVRNRRSSRSTLRQRRSRISELMIGCWFAQPEPCMNGQLA